jgi:UDP-GlcNAc3NAcA epimerase
MKIVLKISKILKTLGLKRRAYCLATVHKRENTDDPVRLSSIISTFFELVSGHRPIIVPVHPGTRKSPLEMKAI